MVLRRVGQDIARTEPAEDRLALEEHEAQPARRGVSSSYDAVQSVVLLRPRTIWLITAIIAGLAAGWVVVGHSLDVWALLFIGIVLAEGLRPLVEGPRAGCPAPSPCCSSTASFWPSWACWAGSSSRRWWRRWPPSWRRCRATCPRPSTFSARPRATSALNPLTVLIAVLAGGSLMGLVGAVLAVPLAVVLEVLVLRVLAPAARHASQRTSAPPSPPARPR